MKRGRNQRRRQGVNPNRALDSNGPDVRIRGTANQIFDKYQALARDASSAGDRIKAESYLQHAEHYYRMIRAAQANQQQQQPQQSQQEGDNEQPSVDSGDDERSSNREPRRARAPRRNGASETEAPAAEEETSGESSPEADDKPAEAEKKPRRKRAPRRTAAKPAEEPKTAGDEEPTPAAAE